MMEKIISIKNTYLGFTNNIKQPIRKNKESVLDKYCRYDGAVMMRKEFIINCLIHGYHAVRKDDVVSYNKRTYVPMKSKIEYRMYEQDEYYIITKTEYDFFTYCQNNNLDSCESIIEYIKGEDYERSLLAKIEAEKERIQAEKEQAKLQEKKRVRAMIDAEILILPEEEKQIMDRIFMAKFGRKADDRSYALIAMIHNYENEVCKREIISRLHNDNVASIKTFECITGLKLPKSYKERIAYLQMITSSDFIGNKEYR